MNRVSTFAASVFGLVLVMVLAQAVRADDQPPAATGSVSVTVTDKDGKPVQGVTVRVTAHKQSAKGDKGATTQPADAAAAGTKADPIASATTDADGKATLPSVPVGDYNLSANLKGQGNARQKITVKAGEPLSVELKLAAKAPKAK
jgi:Carboxypeptidase regulatory-like domain